MKKRPFFNWRNSTAFGIICVFIVLVVSFLSTDAKLRPAVYEFARVEACAEASKTINAVVAETLAKSGASYSDLIETNRDENGRVIGISTDVIKVNLLKARVTGAIDDAFVQKKKIEVSVPLGTVSGTAMLSGLGPALKFRFRFSSSTQSEFKNVFQSAGVNQTQHSVMLNVRSRIIVAAAGKRVSGTVESSFCVAQTVIVGSVPNVAIAKGY